MILRFMGDIPEPKATSPPQEMKAESTSFTKKLYGSISRKFGLKVAEEGDEQVGVAVTCSMCTHFKSSKPKVVLSKIYL